MSSVLVSFRHSLAKCFSTSDFRSSMALSFARLLASSSLDLVMAPQTPASSLLVWATQATSIMIINGLQCGFDVFYALTCGISRAGEVLQLDGLNVFREGFLCTLECLHDLSAEPPRCPRSIIREPQRSSHCICATSPVSSGQRL